MSLLVDARRLMESDGSDGTGACALCNTPPDMTFFGGVPSPLHASDCPWLSLPKIVAALDAAEQLQNAVRRIHPTKRSRYVEDALAALVAALKGEVPA